MLFDTEVLMAARRRGSRDEAAVRGFVERFAETGVLAGLPRMPARAFAALLAAEDGCLTAAELAEQLEVSPAAISGAVRYLANVSMVERRRPIGARRDEYAVPDSWFTMIAARDRILDRWVEQMRSGIDAVGAGTAAGRRLAETAEFFQYLHDEMDAVMLRWHQRTGR